MQLRHGRLALEGAANGIVLFNQIGQNSQLFAFNAVSFK